jgi:hypothetical protein
MRRRPVLPFGVLSHLVTPLSTSGTEGAQRSAENHGPVTLSAADRRRIEGARQRWLRGEADTKVAVRAAHDRGASLRELAAAAGVSRMTVQRWVRAG